MKHDIKNDAEKKVERDSKETVEKLAFDLIAKNTDEEKLAEEGHDPEEVKAVAEAILAGTYFKAM